MLAEVPDGALSEAQGDVSSPAMPDDDKPAPTPFVVDVTVDRTRVQVTLLLKPGTAVTVKETKTTTEPKPAER